MEESIHKTKDEKRLPDLPVGEEGEELAGLQDELSRLEGDARRLAQQREEQLLEFLIRVQHLVISSGTQMGPQLRSQYHYFCSLTLDHLDFVRRIVHQKVEETGDETRDDGACCEGEEKRDEDAGTGKAEGLSGAGGIRMRMRDGDDQETAPMEGEHVQVSDSRQ